MAIAGQNLVSTIDLELQQYGEKLMKGKVGSVVAIEPSYRRNSGVYFGAVLRS